VRSRPAQGDFQVKERMKSVLVTGGAGFIGSTLCPLLAARGYHVRVLDDLSVGSAAALAGVPVEMLTGDIRDRAAVAAAVAGVDAIVHLAAHTSVVDSQAQPEHDFDVNVGGTLNLLLAARAAGVRRFVFASSNAPIGENTPPIDESKPARPLSPYGASKLAGEGYCSAFWGSYGLGTVILRFANVYGPGSTHKGSVVAKFIKDAKATGELTIYGDGEQTRDFIYVDDLCRAVIAGIESACGGETFQIATGQETSVLELAEQMRALLPERELRIRHVEQRAGEIVKNYSAIGKAERVLGWRPQVSLNDGLARTVAWFRQSAEAAVHTTAAQ
jgi:UDP-glucose 4-epimerase